MKRDAKELQSQIKSVEKVKKQIKKKFGTIARFGKIAGIEWEDLNRFFAACNKSGLNQTRLEYLDSLKVKIEALNAVSVSPDELSLGDRLKINSAIEAKGGIKAFCIDNSQFNMNSVYQIMNGLRVRKTKKVLELMKFLGL